MYDDGVLVRSEKLTVPHAFSTRLGGISTLPHTREMNIAEGHGDSAETVRENIGIFARLLTDGVLGCESCVTAHQIHSAKVRILTRENRGEGVTRPAGEDCDGYVTDEAGVIPIVRTADCVPILLEGRKHDGSPVIGVLHAGWRGTVADIAGEGVRVMRSLGAEDIRAAIGPHIGVCHFEVGDDMIRTTSEARGEAFALRHIREHRADLTGMNVELLTEAGIPRENIDVSAECTFCLPEKYHSHRRGNGLRGAMGSAAVIL